MSYVRYEVKTITLKKGEELVCDSNSTLTLRPREMKKPEVKVEFSSVVLNEMLDALKRVKGLKSQFFV